MSELVTIINSSNLPAETRSTLESEFMPLFKQADEYAKEASRIEVTDISQKDLMQEAKTLRLKLKSIRVDSNKKRKELKEHSLRYGKAVQGVYNVIEYLIVPIEKRLEQQEKFAEHIEKKRIAALVEERLEAVEVYSEFIPSGLDFGNLSDDDFNKLLNNAKTLLAQKMKQLKEEEDERIKAEIMRAEEEKKRQEEYQIQMVENARLRKEAEEKEAEALKAANEAKTKADKERAILEEKARVEREKAQVLQRAEEKRLEDLRLAEVKEQERLEKLASAPDKEQLILFRDSLKNLKYPVMKSRKGVTLIGSCFKLVQKIIIYIDSKIESL